MTDPNTPFVLPAESTGTLLESPRCPWHATFLLGELSEAHLACSTVASPEPTPRAPTPDERLAKDQHAKRASTTDRVASPQLRIESSLAKCRSLVDEAFFGRRASIRLRLPKSPVEELEAEHTISEEGSVSDGRVEVKQSSSPLRSNAENPEDLVQCSRTEQTCVLSRRQGSYDRVDGRDGFLSPMTIVSEVDTVQTIPWSRAIKRSAARTLLPPAALPQSILVSTPRHKPKTRFTAAKKRTKPRERHSSMRSSRILKMQSADELVRDAEIACKTLEEAFRIEYELRNS